MAVRVAIVVVAAALLAGCVNNPQLASGLAAPAQAAAEDPDPSKRTLASKVLSAIALERITGLKPDPSRFNELN